MKRAIIYTRVSTDEQAAKGFSLRDQKERLENYCFKNGVEIIAHFQEDHSAKSFDRPEFNRLLEFIKCNKKKADSLLVVKWDRFSRNVESSLLMISNLKELGVKVTAIEQELDDSVRENIILKMIYLAAPQVENARRSMNTTNGMRKAMKEGRWMASCPTGYKDGKDINNKRILILSEKAVLVQESYKLYATGLYEKEEVRKKMIKKGLKLSKDAFARMLKNPVYTGKILIPEYKDEPEQLVKALHDPIIDLDLFNQVQYVANNRSRVKAKPKKIAEEMPLRGLLICSKCGGNLTGSSSRGNGGKYFYYHCQSGCKERFRSEEAHENLNNWLQSITMEESIASLYLAILEDVFNQDDADRHKELKSLYGQREQHKETINKAGIKLINDDLNRNEYKSIKANLEKKLWEINNQINEIENRNSSYMEYSKYGFSLFAGLGDYYNEAEIEVKRKLLGLIFPEKLVYENKKYRTSQPSELLTLLFNADKDFIHFKREKASKFGSQSSMVAPTRIELISSV